VAELFSFSEFVKVIGFPGLIFIIWYVFWRGEKEKWEKQLQHTESLRIIQKEKEDRDRKEHLHKWDTMISTHKSQMDSVIADHNRKTEQLIRSHDAQMQLQVTLFSQQIERAHSISDRQAEYAELTAGQLIKLTEKIDSLLRQHSPNSKEVRSHE